MAWWYDFGYYWGHGASQTLLVIQLQPCPGGSTGDDVKQDMDSEDSDDEDESEEEVDVKTDMARVSAARGADLNQPSPDASPVPSRSVTPVAEDDLHQAPVGQSAVDQVPEASIVPPPNEPATLNPNSPSVALEPASAPNTEQSTNNSTPSEPPIEIEPLTTTSPPLNPFVNIGCSDLVERIRSHPPPGGVRLIERYDHVVDNIPPFEVIPDNQQFAEQIQQERKRRHESKDYDPLQRAEL